MKTPLAKSTGWSVALPRDNQTLHELSIPEPSRRLLRFDDAKNRGMERRGGSLATQLPALETR